MRNKIAALIIIIMLFVVSINPIRGQSPSFEKSYQDYQYYLTQYSQALIGFNNAKTAYFQNPRLSLKNETRQKTFDFLKTRNQLIKAHLVMVKMKIIENEGLSETEKNEIIHKIDPEIEWYSGSAVGYSADDSLETLVQKNIESKDRYYTNTVRVVDAAINYISLGQVVYLTNKHEQIDSQLNTYINSEVESGRLSASPFKGWFIYIDKTKAVLKQNEDDVRREMATNTEETFFNEDFCENCPEKLEASVSQLTNLNGYLTDMLIYIINQK